MAGVVGGTASALGGGKFANGAFTAAFQHLLNAEGETIFANIKGKFYKGFEAISLSPLGYIWNLPNTAVGLGVGVFGLIAEAVQYPFTRTWDFNLTLEYNALCFSHNKLMNGGITFGNVINTGARDDRDYGLKTRYENGFLGDHEMQHTYQGQQLGPFYIPAAGLSLIVGGLSGDHHGAYSWTERGPTSFPPKPWNNSSKWPNYE
jgi:hypothetical protein